jgi:hypothetical protein
MLLRTARIQREEALKDEQAVKTLLRPPVLNPS